MKLIAFAAVLMISAGLGAEGPQAAVPTPQDNEITITGCVVKGDGGYVLLPADEAGSAWPASGTSGAAAEDRRSTLIPVLYWLDDDDELEDHAGQKVEIKGEVEDDLDAGEISVEREDDGLVELEFKHDGKQITVKLPRVPGSIGTSGTVTDEEKHYHFAVRTVDVKKVKMLASACQ